MVDSTSRIYDTALSVRARNALIGRGICTVDDLAACTEDQLLGIKNMGERTVAEIAGFLSEHGLSLRQPNVRAATGWREEAQRMVDHAVTAALQSIGVRLDAIGEDLASLRTDFAHHAERE